MKHNTVMPAGGSVVRRILMALIAVITPAFSAFAQPVLTLEEAIRTALANNYDIRIAENDSALMALDYQYRNAVFLPRLNGTLGTTFLRNNQLVGFTDGTERQGNVATDNINASVALNWTLFDGMRMFAARRRAEEMVTLGELTVKARVVNTVAQVITTYYDIVRQKQQLQAVEVQQALARTRVELAERRLEIGAGARPDVLQSRVDYNAQQAAAYRQETLIRQLKDNLNQLLYGQAIPAEAPDYDVAADIPIQADLTLDGIRDGLPQTNPELMLLRKDIDLAAIGIDEARAGRFPTLDFNAAYNFTRNNNDIALNPALPLFSRNRGLNMGFTVSVPILNFRSVDRQIEIARLNLQSRQLLFDSRRDNIQLEVRNAYREYQFQQEVLALEEANILLAQENVDIIQQTYRLGEVTFIQLREAERSLEEAYNRLIAARYNTKVAETELLRLKGDLVD